MTELLVFRLDDGGSVLAEVEEEPGVARAGRRGSVLQDTRLSFEKALDGVRDAASAALGRFREMSRSPDQIEIKFGVKLDAKAGAVIAQTGMQGHFEVKLTWARDPVAGEEVPPDGP